jgi:hypothetical protein
MVVDKLKFPSQRPSGRLWNESTVVQKLDVFGYNPKFQIPRGLAWIQRARVRNRAGLVLILIIALCINLQTLIQRKHQARGKPFF